MVWADTSFSFFQAEAPPGVETDLIDVGFTDDVKKGGPGRGGGGGGFTAPVGGPVGTVPMPLPMPMPSPNTPFSYPLPKGPVSIHISVDVSCQQCSKR